MQSAAIAEPPRDVGELRLSLMRKLTGFLDHWRACPARACHRHRACASPALECAKMPDREPLNPARDTAALGALQRALARRRAEIEATEGL